MAPISLEYASNHAFGSLHIYITTIYSILFCQAKFSWVLFLLIITVPKCLRESCEL